MKRTIWSSLLLALLLMSMAITMGCSDDTVVNGLSGNGTIGVYPSPEDAMFRWTLTGPGSYAYADSGDVVIIDLAPGEYVLTWQDLNGWVTPEPAQVTQTLGSGKFMKFDATYRPTGGTALPGQVQLNPNPDSIVAPWILQGPDGFEQTGSGDNTLVDMVPGDYTVIWGDVMGWETPESVTSNLVEGEGLTFTAEYLSLSASAFIFETIPAGTFNMGSPRSESGALPHEWPQHSVTLTKDFDMSVTEVSWAQYDRVMGDEPGYVNPSFFYDLYVEAFPDFNWPTHPIDSVTWMDAIRFCNALSTLEGFTPVYTITGETATWDQSADGYRLPTEAEWEYAARGGTSTPLYNGSFEMQASSCYFEPNLEEIAWYCENSPGSGVILQPSPVSSLDANDFGLYDMSGNLWEWVWDVNDTYDGVPMYLGDFDNGSEIIEVGSATIVAALSGLGSQFVMRTQATNCLFGVSSLGITTSQVSISYLDFGTISNLTVNGGDLYIGDLASAPVAPAPGVTLSITTEPTTHETFGAGVVGTIVLTGNVTTLEIGGELLWIDDLAITDSESGSYALNRVVDFDLIKLNSAFFPDDDPFSVELLLGTTVTDPIGSEPVVGDARMLRGGSYANEPRRCRSASRSLISEDSTAEFFFPRYAGFRFVRTINP